MNSIELVPIEYYSKIFYWVMIVLCALTSFSYMSSQGCSKLLEKH